GETEFGSNRAARERQVVSTHVKGCVEKTDKAPVQSASRAEPGRMRNKQRMISHGFEIAQKLRGRARSKNIRGMRSAGFEPEPCRRGDRSRIYRYEPSRPCNS